ncbi:capsule assembly Wzi family protein [Algoriphagus marinus]|uniref:capsule assembly Wzi family protein n=1 Tax=Algoriphagus marinus TaxID=1925762 RepID=UPI001FEB667B|nr:capsule assembly Wzi family protein [Algoriphagus marinus]
MITKGICQTIPSGFPVLEEAARRSQILGESESGYSFALRPIRMSEFNTLFQKLDSVSNFESKEFQIKERRTRKEFKILPLLNTTVYNSNRPYGWGNTSLLNGAGIQNLISPGIFAKFSFLEIQLRPEFVLSQNNSFQGFGGDFSDFVNFSRFRFWNFGDQPEYFGDSYKNFASLGQSYISLNFGKLEMGVGTQNIWWGPGQFTGLIFSNNARGIPHAFIRTSAPINIGIGSLEGQILTGRAEDSGLNPSQNQDLNNQYFLPFSGDWRYISGLSLSYQPKFLKHISLGFNRTFQQYKADVPNTLIGYLPIFEGFQKERLFQNGNSVLYDEQAQDQLLSIFFRFKSEKGKFEIYSELGKHDHNFNWREFILNPEHTRAYLIGFTKLISLPNSEAYLQFKGEIVQQSESVNRYIRYPVLGVLNTSWQTHYQVRGFTNYGESMGAGIGVGSNAQFFEVSRVKDLNRFGILFQRIENHQDFFYRAFGQNPNKKPWVDFSLGVLVDHQWGNLILSSKTQFVKAYNYQWLSDGNSTGDFPAGVKKISFSGELNLIYLFQND